MSRNKRSKQLKGVFPQENRTTLINYDSNNHHLYLYFAGSISFNLHKKETLSTSAFSIVLKLNYKNMSKQNDLVTSIVRILANCDFSKKKNLLLEDNRITLTKPSNKEFYIQTTQFIHIQLKNFIHSQTVIQA